MSKDNVNFPYVYWDFFHGMLGGFVGLRQEEDLSWPCKITPLIFTSCRIPRYLHQSQNVGGDLLGIWLSARTSKLVEETLGWSWHGTPLRLWLGWLRALFLPYHSIVNVTRQTQKWLQGVYHNPYLVVRSQELIELNDFISQLNAPVYRVGDFNNMRSGVDKTGRAPSTQSCASFNWFLNSLGLEVVDNNTHSFTWTNNWQGEALILCRLNWALINHNWFNLLFAFPRLEILYRISFDHNPLLLSIL